MDGSFVPSTSRALVVVTPPPKRSGQPATPGICLNPLCPAGRSRRVLRIELGEPFRCPSCKGPLAAPQRTERNGVGHRVLLMAGIAALAMGGGLVAGISMSRQPAPAPADAEQTQAAVVAPPPPVRVPEKPVSVAPAVVAALPPGPAPVAPPAAVPPSIISQATLAARVMVPVRGDLRMERLAYAYPEPKVPQQPDHAFDPHPLAGGVPPYPDEYADTQRAGHVTADCDIQTNGIPVRCHVADARGGRAFGTAAVAWLTGGYVRFAPIVRDGEKVTERHRVVVDFPAPPPPPVVQPAPAPVVVAAPPAPAAQAVAAKAEPAPKGETRRFSPRPVAGGAPDFPEGYDDARHGEVVVGCLIDTEGVPSGCHVNAVKGGPLFGKMVLEWLNSGRVRYAPILRNGKASAENVVWTIAMQPPG
jgi:hypothetical protein